MDKYGCRLFADRFGAPILDNNALGVANVYDKEIAIKKELGETVLKQNFQGITDYVNEFTSHLRGKSQNTKINTEINTKNIFLLKSVNQDKQKPH